LCLPVSLTATWVCLIAGISFAILSHILQRTLGTEGAASTTKIPLAWQVGLFAAVVTISGAFGATEGQSSLSEAFASLLTLRALLTYFWACHLFSGRREIATRCLQLLLSLTALSGFYGAIQQIFNFHPFTYPYLQGTGFHASPMPFAGQMQLMGMLSLGLLLSGAWKELFARRALFIVLTLGNLAGIVFAGERGAWLGAFVGILAIASMVSWKTFTKAAGALLLIGVLSWAFVPLVQTRVNAALSGQSDVGTRVRFELWSKSIQLWQTSPILGVGIRHFPVLDIPEAIVPGKSKNINHAHSNYFHILSTTGLAGIVAYIWLFISALCVSLGLFHQGKNANDLLAKGIGMGITGGTVALLISGAFEYNFGTAQVRLAQWFLLGLLSLPILSARTSQIALQTNAPNIEVSPPESEQELHYTPSA
jgi:O-antigen ligase